MSSKRQPSKQRRQTQNQKQRAALQARREAAAREAAAAGAAGAPARPAPSGGSMLSRLRGASAQGRAVRTGAAGALPVGHRAALSALIAAIAGAVVGSVLFPVPVGRDGDPLASKEAVVAEWAVSADAAAQDQPEATASEVADAVDDWSPAGTEPYAVAYFPISMAVVLPVIGAGIGFRAVSRRAGAKVVNRTMYVTLFGTLLTSQLLLVFLPAIISLAVAAFQVRKAEIAASAAARADGDDDVIDVASVEADDVETADDDGADAAVDPPDDGPDGAADREVDTAPAEPRSVIGRLRRPPR